MPQKYTGRVLAILIVLGIALFAIFSPSITDPKGVMFNPQRSVFEKTNLKPGIDIVGGTSLLYEIKQPEGVYIPNLAEEVMKHLRDRVDPKGTLNLIWRPQGNNRLEVQLPLLASSGHEAEKAQKQLEEARAKLEAGNVSVPALTEMLEGRNGKTRADFDKVVAAAPAERKAALTELAAAYDAMEQAKQAKDVEAGEKADTRLKAAQAQLAQTNATAAEVDRILSLKGSKEQKLEEFKKKNAARLPEINAYIAAVDNVAANKSIDSANELKRKLQGAGLLEFHILATPGQNIDMAQYQQMVQRLQTEGPRVKAGDDYRWFEVDKPDEFQGRAIDYNDRKYVLASIKREDSLDAATGKWALTNSYPSGDNTGQTVVAFSFDTFGGTYFGELTRRHVGKPMAIMLDGRVISAPNINSPITGGSGIITGGGQGGFNPKESGYLVSMLKAGSLPAQLESEPLRERTVGPQLGEDNLRAGLLACGLGLIVVAIFLIGYYYLSGLIAFVAVLLNIIIILGCMGAIGATFTLPGIAAIVLTVGTAVDANVLIFERLREEQLRGLSIRMALRNAYDRAFSAIIDSNMTTIITSAFLIIFGTEEVKGFGITLIIGILASLFTALFVTKTLFGLLLEYRHIKKLGSIPMSFPKWDQFLRPNINWIKLSWPFVAFSVILITVGTALFVKYLNAGQVFDIEFASGTAVTFELKQPMKQEQIRDWMDEAAKKNPTAFPSPGVVRVGSEGTVWEVTTPNADRKMVQDIIIGVLGDREGGKKILKAEQESKFAGLGQPIDKVLDQVVIPLTGPNLADATKWPTGVVPPKARDFSGGAAVVLRELDPPLSASQIEDRIKRQTLQIQGDQKGIALPSFAVWTAGKPEEPVNLALVLVNNADLPVDKDRDKWLSGVVDPAWKVIRDGIAQPAQLRQVTTFDKSVASDTQRQALIALTLSILGIMAYIWFRFGNLKYGTATVVALVHDVAFTIAGIGLAHALSGTWFGDALQLQPFRINTTIVAGILTVMGFSMLDTIVVFDRVRELRGKFGHLSHKVINDAVNQTLSRTLLTAGTTIVSIAIMYFIGGPGIHGFTFILFIGILVGTYSSVAIASPLLLVGGEKAEEPSRQNASGKLQQV